MTTRRDEIAERIRCGLVITDQQPPDGVREALYERQALRKRIAENPETPAHCLWSGAISNPPQGSLAGHMFAMFEWALAIIAAYKQSNDDLRWYEEELAKAEARVEGVKELLASSDELNVALMSKAATQSARIAALEKALEKSEADTIEKLAAHFDSEYRRYLDAGFLAVAKDRQRIATAIRALTHKGREAE